jgi:hypothetical protein
MSAPEALKAARAAGVQLGADGTEAEAVRANPLKSYTGTTADGADANSSPQSALEKTDAPGWSERP